MQTEGIPFNAQFYLRQEREDAIWFGVDDADPKIMASETPAGGTGWVKYEIPSNVLLTTRMHLTQEQVKELLPILTVFAETGELPS